ncbi:hypothetical protein ALC53_01154 [Atta colombica]|uniref:Uncharacterized protein n=1 Tax=Atta colombica TaxID=520822 RepID=A0A195BVU8_9HYME|nr:hypothetical protein ALC53_01154 [Atta colombica]
MDINYIHNILQLLNNNVTYKIVNIHNIIFHGMRAIDREPHGYLFLLSLAPKHLLLNRAFSFLCWLKICEIIYLMIGQLVNVAIIL